MTKINFSLISYINLFLIPFTNQMKHFNVFLYKIFSRISHIPNKTLSSPFLIIKFQLVLREMITTLYKKGGRGIIK